MIELLGTRATLAVVLLGIVTAASLVRARAPPSGPISGRLPTMLLPPGHAPLVAVYFTSRLCSDCLVTPHLLAEAAPQVPHIPLAVERHADVARRIGVTQTPTILLVDSEGVVRQTFAGLPTAGAIAASILQLQTADS